MTAATLAFLRGLCAGLSPIPVEVIEDERITAFEPGRGRILVARRFLEAEGPVATGALLHEMGHLLATRYHRFRRPSGVSAALWRHALNAVEETRIHLFLRRRLPGAWPYLRALFAMDPPPRASRFESDLMVFLAAAAIRDRYRRLPFVAAFPVAAGAFARAASALQRYTEALPPADFATLPGLGARFARDVEPWLDGDCPDVTPVEAEILCAAAAALQVFMDGIWPVILGLMASDRARIVCALGQDPGLRAQAERVAGRPDGARLARWALRAVPASGETPGTADVDIVVAKLAEALFRNYIDDESAKPAWRRVPAGMPGGTGIPIGDDADLALGIAGPSIGAGESDAAALARRGTLVDALRRAVPVRPIEWTPGCRSGPLLDIGRVMHEAATRRADGRIWARRRAVRPALAAMLLVDLSGSMRGDKVEAAIAATRTLSAALAEVRGVSWCVLGFQDRTIPIVGFHERATPEAMVRIESMREEVAGTRPGGNNQPSWNDDGPCLREAAAELRTRPERDRLLIVISDGSPAGRRSDADDLHAAVAEVHAMPDVALVGLGIGPATGHVTRYYPVSRADVALDDLATVIGGLLGAG
jgi:hypothetical protein